MKLRLPAQIEHILESIMNSRLISGTSILVLAFAIALQATNVSIKTNYRYWPVLKQYRWLEPSGLPYKLSYKYTPITRHYSVAKSSHSLPTMSYKYLPVAIQSYLFKRAKFNTKLSDPGHQFQRPNIKIEQTKEYEPSWSTTNSVLRNTEALTQAPPTLDVISTPEYQSSTTESKSQTQEPNESIRSPEEFQSTIAATSQPTIAATSPIVVREPVTMTSEPIPSPQAQSSVETTGPSLGYVENLEPEK